MLPRADRHGEFTKGCLGKYYSTLGRQGAQARGLQIVSRKVKALAKA